MDRAKGYDWGVAEQEANAKLIVDAPRLALIAEAAEKMAEAAGQMEDETKSVPYHNHAVTRFRTALSDYRLAVKGKAGE